RVPGQADHQEAGRDAHGSRQGERRGVGRRGEDGPHPLRDGGSDAGDRQGSHGARVAQAALDHPARQPQQRAGSVTMKAAELKELSVEELTRKAGELRENLFNLKIRRRAGTLEATSDVTKNKRDLARILTLPTQKTGSSKAQRKAAPKQPQARQPAEQRDRT